MNLKRCSNGHFYDADQYASCPHCNPTVSATDVTVALSEEVTDSDIGARDNTENTLSLEDIVKEAKSDNAAPQSGEKTISYYAQSLGTDPVVGWLAGIEGSHYGEGFALKSGRNFIGRSDSMDVALTGDTSVAREKHAVIIYEPKTRTFIAQPGDSRELFYVNDSVVLNNTVLKSYDVLEVGKEKLIFMALCGEQFCWEDTKKTE